MLSIAQIRGLQTAMTALALPASAGQRNDFYQTLTDTLALPNRELTSSRLLQICTPATPAVRGLLFGYKDDPAFRRHVTLPDNREAPAALHLELPKSELKPTLLGLHYVHGMHRRATTAYYMLSGALEVHETPGFEYTRMKKKTASLTQLSEFLYTLNTPVAALDYPKGRKLAVVDILKKLDVHYVGDLVRKSEDELKAALGQTHWLTVRSLLKNLKLAAGVPIPQWRRPSVK